MRTTNLFSFFVLLPVLCLAASPATAKAPVTGSSVMAEDAALRAKLDALVPPLLAGAKVPSVSIARIHDGRLSLLAAYGEQSPGRAADTGTLYNVASMAKPVSAELALRLVAQEQVALDEPMAAFWVDPDIATDPRRNGLTPRFSLSHQTGFPNWRYQTDDVLVFQHAPGEAFGYSGEGIEYLARFIERKTGQGFEALVQSQVLDPAGMRDTTYTRRDGLEDRIAQPVDREGQPLAPQIVDTAVASDDLYTTPADYARFLLSLMAHQGVDAVLADERARIQASRLDTLCPPPRDPACPRDAGFGLGWEVYAFAHDTYLMHTGMDDGTFAIGYYNPGTRSATVIFTPSQNGVQLVFPILDAIGEDAAMVDFLRYQVR